MSVRAQAPQPAPGGASPSARIRSKRSRAMTDRLLVSEVVFLENKQTQGGAGRGQAGRAV